MLRWKSAVKRTLFSSTGLSLSARSYTIATALLPNKQEKTYTEMLKCIAKTYEENGKTFDFVFVHCDCEQGLINAIQSVSQSHKRATFLREKNKVQVILFLLTANCQLSNSRHRVEAVMRNRKKSSIAPSRFAVTICTHFIHSFFYKNSFFSAKP